MLDYPTFKKHMTEIVQAIRFYEGIDDFCRERYPRDDLAIRTPTLIDTAIDLLEHLMDDKKGKWIEYYVYETDCGKRNRIVIIDEQRIQLYSIEALYDILTFYTQDSKSIDMKNKE